MKVPDNLTNILPEYLTNTEKGRIERFLRQFAINPDQAISGNNSIDYSDFFDRNGPNYLMQSDILNSVKALEWDFEARQYLTRWGPGILISNSCDVTDENIRAINEKNVLFAPIIPLDEYLQDKRNDGFPESQIISFVNNLRNQQYSNLFYLPRNPKNHNEYIVPFDYIYWQPPTELEPIVEDLDNNRFISFSNIGFYLFIVKLSIHFCRVPEEIERRNIA